MKNQLLQISSVCALVLFNTLALAQTRTITGKVIDESSDPVVGAVIKEKGSRAGAIAGNDGSFSIKITTSNPVLVITFIGMESQEYAVGSATSVTIRMKAKDESFGEVVVTAQNVFRSSRSIGYAVTSVSDVDLTEGGDRSVLNSIQGKVAGVNITQASADPGASSRILIRGVQSMTQGNQPLIVIDGVPMTNSSVNSSSLNGGFDFGNGLNAVNPEDVESIEILKGSNATALYGSRAANGVLMITTKKGSSSSSAKKAIGIEYSGNVVFNSVLRMPEFQNTFGQGWDGNHWLDENGSWGPVMDGRRRVFGRVVDNSQQIAEFSPLENNVRDFFERGVSIKNHVAINGGSENNNFYASFSNVNQDGIYPVDVDRYNRNTLALRGMQNFGKIRVSGTTNFSETENSFVPTGQGGQSVYNNLMQLPRNLSVLDMQDYTAKFYNPDDYFTPYGVTNPYFILNENGTGYNGNKFFGGVETTIDILENLTGTYRFGYDIESHSNHVHRAILLPEGPNSGSVDDEGFVSEQKLSNTQLNHDFLLSWDKEVSPIFKYNVLGGANINSRATSSMFTSVASLDIPGFYNLSNSPATPIVSESETLRRLAGLFGIISTEYKNMLFFNISARNDWSSTLPAENRSFFYPAANMSYVFTESLGAKPSWLDYGKLRVGYGWSGNDAPVYVTEAVYTQGSNYMPFRRFTYPLATGVNGFSVGNRIKNPELQPEITKELEVGTDLRLLDNRIVVDFTYYNRVTDAQIFTVPVAPSSGYSNYVANPASVENKGIEAMVSYRVFRSDNGFNWMASANFTRNRNKVLNLDKGVEQFGIGGLSTIGYFARAGFPIGLYEYSVPETSPDGGIVVDANGVPVAASDKLLDTLNSSQQNYILGISNSFSWKGFNLGFTFDIRNGGLMFSRTADINFFTGNTVKTTYNDRKPFIVPNSVQKVDNGDGTFTYVENDIAVDPAHMDDYHRAIALERQNIIDKSFTKLREVNLSYTLPASTLEKLPFAGLQVSLIGRNLFLWTPVDNQFIDPEVTTFGNGIGADFGEFSANPTTRSYGFALTFTL